MAAPSALMIEPAPYGKITGERLAVLGAHALSLSSAVQPAASSSAFAFAVSWSYQSAAFVL